MDAKTQQQYAETFTVFTREESRHVARRSEARGTYGVELK